MIFVEGPRGGGEGEGARLRDTSQFPEVSVLVWALFQLN